MNIWILRIAWFIAFGIYLYWCAAYRARKGWLLNTDIEQIWKAS